MSANGRYVAILPSGSEFGELIKVGASETQGRVRFPFRSGAVLRSVSADGRWVLGHDMIGNMLVADTQSQRVETHPLGAAEDFENPWTFGPQGDRFVTIVRTSDKGVGIMTVWEAETLQSVGSTEVPLDSIEVVWGVALSPDGAWVAAALGGDFQGPRGGANFLIWNPAARKMKVIPTGHPPELFACTFLPDGKTLVVADREGNIDLFSLEQWPPRRIRSMLVDQTDFWGIACSADGKRLYAHSTADLYVLSTYSGRLLGTFNGIPSSRFGYGFAVHPDGSRVVQLNRGNLQIWHAPSWAEIEAAENARMSLDKP